ncbi:hypothetical protein M2126_002140, partial [Polynucleobacter sphagniphilus]|nr:hypothetical protein [Polynucleobacter sphagniphilus]MDH6513473.1 hypothetical protein [Polynucleobacter sphagniphilus]
YRQVVSLIFLTANCSYGMALPIAGKSSCI